MCENMKIYEEKLNSNFKLEKHLNKLILGQTITVKFLNIVDYIEKTGMIIKIDRINKMLYLPNLEIPFSSILAIKVPL